MSTSLKNLFLEEVASGLHLQPVSTERVYSEKDIARLPAPVQRYFRHCGYIGKPWVKNICIEWKEVFLKLALGREWKPIDCYQVNFASPPARLVYMKSRLLGMVPFEGRDKYQYGHGNMLIKLLKLITINDVKGKEMDASALVTLLAELPLLPSYALHPGISWTVVDDTTAKATIRDNGTAVSGTFYFNVKGEILRFTTDDRYYVARNKQYQRMQWSAVAEDYVLQNGVRYPSRLTAIWHTEQGDFTYFKGSIQNILFNVQGVVLP